MFRVSGFESYGNTAVAAGPFDLDGDTLPDLIIPWSAPDPPTVHVWYGPVAGVLDPGAADARVVLPDGVTIGSVGWAGDHDGDGTEDLLVGWNDAYEASGAWLLLGGSR